MSAKKRRALFRYARPHQPYFPHPVRHLALTPRTRKGCPAGARPTPLVPTDRIAYSTIETVASESRPLHHCAVRGILRSFWLIGLAATLATPNPAFGLSAASDTLSAYQQQIGWTSRDKGYHFALSALGAAGVYSAVRALGFGRAGSAIASVTVVGTAGILREVLAVGDPDRLFTSDFFSRRDMVWNGVGIAVGVTTADLFHRRRSRNGDPPAPALPPPPKQR